MARGPAAVLIELTDGERESLARWARRRRSAAGVAQRSRIVLACAEGLTNVAVAERVGSWARVGDRSGLSFDAVEAPFDPAKRGFDVFVSILGFGTALLNEKRRQHHEGKELQELRLPVLHHGLQE